MVVILQGDLGSGKTVFAQGIGRYFDQQFVSPTYVLMNEYLINQAVLKKVYHLDLYRLETPAEVASLELEEFLQPGHLLLIEWGEKLSTLRQLQQKNVAFYLLQLIAQSATTRSLSLYQFGD